MCSFFLKSYQHIFIYYLGMTRVQDLNLLLQYIAPVMHTTSAHVVTQNPLLAHTIMMWPSPVLMVSQNDK